MQCLSKVGLAYIEKVEYLYHTRLNSKQTGNAAHGDIGLKLIPRFAVINGLQLWQYEHIADTLVGSKRIGTAGIFHHHTTHHLPRVAKLQQRAPAEHPSALFPKMSIYLHFCYSNRLLCPGFVLIVHFLLFCLNVNFAEAERSGRQS
jgi:hypothetical protein